MDVQPMRKFGVVVVGVGRAGSVRIRDLQNPGGSSAYLNLIGFVSRRELGSIGEVQQISLEDALSSQEVDVAFICSESSSHEHYIRQFLSAGKHVLVEYPMTLSLAAAQELWDLAEKKGDRLRELGWQSQHAGPPRGPYLPSCRACNGRCCSCSGPDGEGRRAEQTPAEALPLSPSTRTTS
ncbi:biliverdin reductase A-like [Thomomys bottae]